MKPRNNFERAVVAAMSTLPPLTREEERRAVRSAYKGSGFKFGGKIRCMECGEWFRDKSAKHHTTCPHCGKKLRVEHSQYRSKCVSCVAMLYVHEGFQVIRNIYVYYHKKENEFRPLESMQNWIDESGKIAYASKKVSIFPLYIDDWSEISEISLRYYDEKNLRNDRLKSRPNAILPYPKILGKLKRNGFKPRILHDAPLEKVISRLLCDPCIESVYKCGQYQMASYMASSGDDRIEKYLPSLKICVRHGYKIQKPESWLDMVEALEYIGKDIRSPKYVCPDNFMKMHDKAVEKKGYLVSIKEAEEYEETYYAEKKRFFGLDINDGGIFITAMRSVKDIMNEGNIMHHCVFKMGYYKRQDSLILSAKDKDGVRIETIEVSLNTFQILQCHGRWDKDTQYHERIKKLVNMNMGMIKKMYQSA